MSHVYVVSLFVLGAESNLQNFEQFGKLFSPFSAIMKMRSLEWSLAIFSSSLLWCFSLAVE